MPNESDIPETDDAPDRPVHEDPPASRPESRIRGVTGIVLAGGKSRRYGRNKALEPIQGVPIIERTVRTLKCVFHHVLISTNNPADFDFLHLPHVEDRVPGWGPLGGLQAALLAMPDEAGFFVACDMPLLNPDLIRHMARLGADADAVVPRIGGYLEPLHALYRRTCLNAVKRAIDRGDHGIRSFFPDIRIHFMEEDAIRTLNPALDAFVNVNRPGELRRLLSGRESKGR